MESGEDLFELVSIHWSHLFSSVDRLTSISLTKVSSRNWLISCLGGLSYILKSVSIDNNLDFELKYLIDLNEYFCNEYRVPIPILTVEGLKHVNGKYWLYEYIDGKVYSDNDTTHLFDEKHLISLAKLISRYHQYLIKHSIHLSTNKKNSTREHLINELKQSLVIIPKRRILSYLSFFTLGFDFSINDDDDEWFN